MEDNDLSLCCGLVVVLPAGLIVSTVSCCLSPFTCDEFFSLKVTSCVRPKEFKVQRLEERTAC